MKTATPTSDVAQNGMVLKKDQVGTTAEESKTSLNGLIIVGVVLVAFFVLLFILKKKRKNND